MNQSRLITKRISSCEYAFHLEYSGGEILIKQSLRSENRADAILIGVIKTLEDGKAIVPCLEVINAKT